MTPKYEDEQCSILRHVGIINYNNRQSISFRTGTETRLLVFPIPTKIRTITYINVFLLMMSTIRGQLTGNSLQTPSPSPYIKEEKKY